MDDEGISSGLGSVALFEMGRQDERWRQQQFDAVSAFAARLRGYVPTNLDDVLAENQALRQNGDALWQDNQRLRQLVVEYHQELQGQYDNKCEWITYAEAVAAERDALLAQKAAREDDIPW